MSGRSLNHRLICAFHLDDRNFGGGPDWLGLDVFIFALAGSQQSVSIGNAGIRAPLSSCLFYPFWGGSLVATKHNAGLVNAPGKDIK